LNLDRQEPKARPEISVSRYFATQSIAQPGGRLGPFRQAAEFATFRIRLDLAIPYFGVVALEPRDQTVEAGGRRLNRSSH